MPDYLTPRANPYLPQLPDLSQIRALLQNDATPAPMGALATQATTTPPAPSSTNALALLGALQGQKSQGGSSSQKKPDKGGGGGSGGASGPHDLPRRPNALQYAKAAAQEAHVPESWAKDKRFWYILSHESGLSKHDPYHAVLQAAHNANPTSSAYGIGQFLDATWNRYNKTSDPYKQLVDTFIYIKGRYGNIGAAYAYKKAKGTY